MHKKYIWIFVFLYIAFIFSNSLQIGDTSSALSGGITKLIYTYIQAYVPITFDTFHYFIRKLAHFSEYAFLGLLVTYASLSSPILQNKKLNIFLFCIGVPCIDETLQLFVPGRNGAILDVLIDMSGFLFTYCCYRCVSYFMHKLVKD